MKSTSAASSSRPPAALAEQRTATPRSPERSSRSQPREPSGILQGLVPARSSLRPRRHAAEDRCELPPAPDRRHGQLVGESIDPKVAERYLHEVAFDDIGRIEGFPLGSLEPGQVAELEGARIRPLTATNSQAPREAPRTERECLVRLIHLLAQAKTPESQSLLREARTLWISGVVNRESMERLLSRAHGRLSRAPALQEAVRQMQGDVAKPKTLPQYHDNIYGRHFESAFVLRLVQKPPGGTTTAARRIGEVLLGYLDRLSESDRRVVLTKAGEMVREDARPWFGKKPQMDAFAQDPSRATLRALLDPVQDGLDVVKTLYMAQKLTEAGAYVTVQPPWGGFAQSHYDHVVVPSRSGLGTPINPKSNANGIALPYHPSQMTDPAFGSESNWTLKRTPNMQKPMPFERNALENGHVFVSGASGNVTILTSLALHAARDDPDFSMGDALLAGAMFMVFDTGHSAHEILATRASLQAGSSAEGAATLGRFNASYAALGQLPASLGDRMRVEHALEQALDDTIAYFEEHTLGGAGAGDRR